MALNFPTELEMLQELFEINFFLSSSCQAHSENGFENLYNIFSMKHVRMFLVLHRWWALVVKSVGWSAPEILKCSFITKTNSAAETRQLLTRVGFGQNQPHPFIIYTEKFTLEISHADGYQKCWFLWGFPSSNNCTWRRNRKRFCDVLTLVWRRFPVKPERHRHCSCSQNWHHSPGTAQKAEVSLWSRKLKGVLIP